MKVEDLTCEHFAPLVNKTFQIQADSSAIEAELIEARPLGRGRKGRREPFSLIFRAPASAVLPQRIYTVHSEALGALDIFLVPIGPHEAGTGLLYEAIFT
jgi:hypothetical protein